MINRTDSLQFESLLFESLLFESLYNSNEVTVIETSF